MKRLIAILLLFVSTLCFSAEPAQQEQDTSSADMIKAQNEWFGEGKSYSEDSKIVVNSILSGMAEFSQNFYTRAQPVGEKLFMLLAIITLSWTGIQIALSSGEASFGEQITTLIKSVFLSGFVYYILQPAGFDLLVKGTLAGLTDQLAEIALPPGASIDTGFLNFTSAQMQIISKILEKTYTFDIFDILQKVAFNAIFTVLLIVIFIICSVIAFVAFLSAMLVQSIAFALAPIFIATLINQKTSFLFDGWLKFTIAACFTKVIVTILVSVGLFTFERVAAAPVAGMMLLFSSVVAGALIAYQMLQAPEFAQSLTSGGAVGFSKLVSSSKRAIGNALKK